MRMREKLKYFIVFLILFFPISISHAWDCKTHAYIAKKAGIRIPEAACMPDIIRDENYDLLAPFHYHDASPDTVVTPEYIDKFGIKEAFLLVDGKNFRISVPHPAGVLYWKIVQIYEKMKSLDRTKPDNVLAYEYYLVSIAHYIGDLSQPLHNFPYGDSPASDGKMYEKEGYFNREYHIKFDEAFSHYLNTSADIHIKIDNAIKQIKLSSKEDLKKEISEIANSAIKIANKCYNENRLPNEEELIKQISWSISLLRAVIISTN
ncbi:conserved hypothetical protein [Thermodesulfovibrio yellowstonii DSM 11347]|uniref:Uncharacterized protein n=2 Tax=Thermodesulfovibrio yellowstonii TaxID=28262 RepID=B5YKD8_THEYD|nr:conserved hypothetical protein [Thermodesulfovibrio yellowstonii DSM 11347]MDI6865749.1 S1/P1 nuclease [Thermodesulfovibrio yellowstonii]